jgi:hypothetical protein
MRTYLLAGSDIRHRFDAMTDKSGGQNACWPWTGSISEGFGGYGIFRGRIASRVAWALANNREPGPLDKVCHTCDNPRCVNPTHLFLGSQKDNIHDALKKGRLIAGLKHPNCRLTEQQIIAIKADARRIAVIAAEYQMSRTAIYRIKDGRSYKSILAAS